MPVALGGDEGRDKLRKAAVRGKYPATRGCPNGETRAQVVASERAGAQTGAVHCCRARGCRTGAAPRHQSSGTLWKVGP